MASIIGVSGDKITENRIAQAINEIPVGLAVVDANRRFRFRNTLFERQHAYLLLPAPVNNLEGLMQAIDGRYSLGTYIKNLEDDLQLQDTPAEADKTHMEDGVRVNAPRTFGVRLNVNF